jgi:DNA-binding MarR family transcriptional regulator
MHLDSALKLMTNFRVLGQEMPMAQAYCLLLIAKHEGLSLKELAYMAKVGMASASRYVSQFGEVGEKGQPGMNLVAAYEDPMERRKKIIKLTPKGKLFVHKLLGEN